VNFRQNVESWGKIQVNSQAPEFQSLDAPLFPHVLFAARIAGRQIIGKKGNAFLQMDDAPALMVHSDEKLPLQGAFERSKKSAKLLRGMEIPAEKDQTSREGFAEKGDKLGRHLLPGNADHQSLADTFFQFHRGDFITIAAGILSPGPGSDRD
jgi:hypothetical protein